jgi:histidine triad (HIT) family protein
MISKFLFRLAKTAFMGKIVGAGFAHFSFLIPVKKVLETDSILAFYHPKPAWANHLVIVPKKSIATLLELGRPDNIKYVPAIFFAARDVIAKLGFEDIGYVFCANGGPRQEVGQVHFHLFTGQRLVSELSETAEKGLILQGKTVAAFHHPEPNWETQIVVVPTGKTASLCSLDASDGPVLEETLSMLRTLDEQFQLVKRGYTLVVQEMSGSGQRQFLCHVVAGKRTKKIA